MRVLVTGGAGYVGSVTAERLVAEGHQTVVVDSFLKGHRGAVPDGATLVDGGDRLVDVCRVADVGRELLDELRVELSRLAFRDRDPVARVDDRRRLVLRKGAQRSARVVPIRK